ncbi:hypothetical protein [Dielma fastidiosa]|uniref:hypothetical protein n=1 Tax=Dielma fastidiosa TaxID=1034346 RepID=UPI0015FE16E7|nr:hypothetical protein [Dielma fastidiosa]
MEAEVNYIVSCKNQIIVYLDIQKVIVYTDRTINGELKRYIQSRLPGITLIEKH